MFIAIAYPGAAPDVVEREVVTRFEDKISSISGVDKLNSTSTDGFAQIVVQFVFSKDVNQATQDVRDAISAVRSQLPAEILEPVVRRFDPNTLPIVSLAITSTALSPTQLTQLADQTVGGELRSIAGVAQVNVVGGDSAQLNVDVRPADLAAAGVGLDQVVAALRGQNLAAPVGNVESALEQRSIRLQGRFDRPEDFAGLVLSSRGGQLVRLGQVADVSAGAAQPTSAALFNGAPAIGLDIVKSREYATTAVSDGIKARIAKLRSTLPADTRIETVRDAGVRVRNSVKNVEDTLIGGAVLTILVVFLFLNSWRSTVITGLALPVSVLTSFAPLLIFGFTLNVMSLMGLSLAIGILIDDAIVVRENIVRHLEHGQDHFTAAREGTAEIGLAVMATSLSVMAVFIPVAFMKGIIGRFFFQFGMTVAFAVLVSLFVSFTLDPMLSSRWHDPDIDRSGKRHFIARILDRFNDWFDRTADKYKRAIAWALDHRKVVVGVAAAAFAAGLVLLGTLQTEFFPIFDHGEFVVRFKTAPDASIEETKGRLDAVLKVLKIYPEIDLTYAAIAPAEGDTVQNAMVYAHLKEKGERTRDQHTLMRDVRSKLQRVPGIILSIEEDPDNNQKPLMLLVRGEEIPKLKEYAAAIKQKMYGIAGIKDLEATLEHDQSEYRLVVDRERARQAGIGTDTLVRTIGALVGGQIVSTYEDETGEAVNVRVRLPESLRQDVKQVSELRIAVPSKESVTLVPIADLVRVERSLSPSEISRQDLSRQVVISANLDNLPLGTAADRAMKAAATVPMAPGYSAQMS
ncbi:MAG TPA: efflux RND transporter permease subunit, partial [Thermoanaerobaculia bacterium]|nr:efflux RND transporter permease subunit [Thermoanaerobaculia bacterium]